jgi:hypothetical protein
MLLGSQIAGIDTALIRVVEAGGVMEMGSRAS